MKIASFSTNGTEDFGLVQGQSVVPSTVVFGDPDRHVTLLEVLDDPELRGVFERADLSQLDSIPLSDVALLPAIPRPGKIICVGLNYGDHAKEAGRVATAGPALFVRFPESQTAHGKAVAIPNGTALFDYEGELAVVIGRAEGDIVGPLAFGCYNDFTSRDWQRHSTQWTAGKNFSETGAFGPTVVTVDSWQPDTERWLETRVNGEVRQRAPLGDMIYTVEALVDYITAFTTLNPGDVIVTGTPAGTGAFFDPPRPLRPGDEVIVTIDGLDPLTNTVA